MLEEDATGPLADMLRAAQGDVLTEEQVEAVRKGLVVGGIVASTATAAGAVTRRGLLAVSTPAKLALALAAVAVGSAGAYLALRGHPSAPRSGVPTAAVPTAAVPTATQRAPAVEEGAPPPAGDMPARERLSTSDQAKVAPPPAPKTSAFRVSLPAAPSASSASPLPPVAAIPEAEGALLLQAREALETDPARALALVREHEKRFPQSQLAPERARIAAEAANRLHP
jgi:hypothetical protein